MAVQGTRKAWFHCHRGSFHLDGVQVVPSKDYGPDVIPSECPYQIQDPQIVVGTEGKEAYNREEAINVPLPSNSNLAGILQGGGGWLLSVQL